jgi:hypothetical protein
LIAGGCRIGGTDLFLTGAQESVFNFKKTLEDIRSTASLKTLVLIGHVNDDRMPGNENGTGLVAYAFKKTETNEICFLCRGSEGGVFSFVPDWVEKIKQHKWAEIFQAEDWRDNFNMIYQDSTNFEPLKQFTQSIMAAYGNADTAYSVYGHSKGGGLAIYLAALFGGMDGAAVDGVGLPVVTYMENARFIGSLRQSGLRNIIAENDIVGRMLVHYEKQVSVKMTKNFVSEHGETVHPDDTYAFQWAHYPDAIFTDDAGAVVPSKKKRFLPTVIGIINNVLMMKILYDKLSENECHENAGLWEKLQEKSILLLDALSVD